jgi:hypothetical protein
LKTTSASIFGLQERIRENWPLPSTAYRTVSSYMRAQVSVSSLSARHTALFA